MKNEPVTTLGGEENPRLVHSPYPVSYRLDLSCMISNENAILPVSVCVNKPPFPGAYRFPNLNRYMSMRSSVNRKAFLFQSAKRSCEEVTRNRASPYRHEEAVVHRRRLISQYLGTTKSPQTSSLVRLPKRSRLNSKLSTLPMVLPPPTNQTDRPRPKIV